MQKGKVKHETEKRTKGNVKNVNVKNKNRKWKG